MLDQARNNIEGQYIACMIRRENSYFFYVSQLPKLDYSCHCKLQGLETSDIAFDKMLREIQGEDGKTVSCEKSKFGAKRFEYSIIL